MPYPDGTLTTDEHVAEALQLTEWAQPDEDVDPGVSIAQAIRGLTHAVLALVANQEDRRAEGRGW